MGSPEVEAEAVPLQEVAEVGDGGCGFPGEILGAVVEAGVDIAQVGGEEGVAGGGGDVGRQSLRGGLERAGFEPAPTLFQDGFDNCIGQIIGAMGRSLFQVGG